MPSPSSDLAASAARAVRTSARIALWSSLTLTVAAALLLSRFSSPLPPESFRKIPAEMAMFEGVDFLSYPEVRLLKSYVQIDTSLPDPRELAGAEFLAAQLEAAGVPATIERLAGDRANLWAFVEGDDPRALVLSGHIDVEPAIESQGWRFPPFGGAIEGPWIYGRGMYDMKSLTIAQLLATIDAATSGRRPKRSILFLQTAGEEEGSDLGLKWILDQHPELVERMGSVLTEGGVIEAISPSDIKYWGIEYAQKSFGKMRICSRDRRALVQLRELLQSTGKGDPHLELAPGMRPFLERYGPSRGAAFLARLLANPDRLIRDAVQFDRLTAFQKALFRDEVWPLPITRAAGGEFQLDVWLHLMPDSDFDQVRQELLPDWKLAGFATTPLERLRNGPPSPLDHPDLLAVERMVAGRFPEITVGPYFLPWAATDSRLFRAAGVPAYGFSPFPVTVFDTVQMGKANERMQLPAFLVGVDLYRKLVRELIE